jgi:hypothetical protein
LRCSTCGRRRTARSRTSLSTFNETRRDLDFRPAWTTIDPAAQNRHHSTGRNLQQDYAQHRDPDDPGAERGWPGYNRIKEARQVADPDEPLLVVHASCVDLVDEFHKYRWKSPVGRQVDKPRADPIKRNDDLLDALEVSGDAAAASHGWRRARSPSTARATPNGPSGSRRVRGKGQRRWRIGGVL